MDNIYKVYPGLADAAYEAVKGDRQAAYNQYIKLHYRQTGRLAPGCDNKDLQAYYDLTYSKIEREGEEHK